MRTCVIFNPTAKGDKARHFRHHLDSIGADATLMHTRSAGDARRLAAEAVRDGFEIIVGAGGDGTVNEVLNGLGDAPKGFDCARLAVLPLGTVNVFAKELGIPGKLEPAWEMIRAAKETRIDLPMVEFGVARERRYFVQLAGAGLDARAIELLSWRLKKQIGPLAYIVAGLSALRGRQPKIHLQIAETTSVGELIMIGNGRYYGGKYQVFPQADLRDGLLEVTVFPHANWFTLLRCGPQLLLQGTLPKHASSGFRGETVTLSSDEQAALEVDGELIGHLPATFSVRRDALRVIVP